MAELDGFKTRPEFWRVGFGVGGPYSRWLTSLKDKRDAPDFSFAQRVAVGDLQAMGLDYLYNHGRETDFTRFARAQLRELLQP